MAHLKVACLGGSFNPIHHGHIALANYLLDTLHFDQVWLILAKQAPLKEAVAISYQDRLAMINLAIAKHERIKACTIEKDMPTPNYTIDTILQLQLMHNHDFSFVIGADQAMQFNQWKQAEKLLKMVPFYVVSRDNYTIDPTTFKLLPSVSTTSSSQLRHGLSNDTHSKVLNYMINHHLYDHTILATHLKPKRLAHTLSVAQTAVILSESLAIDQDQLKVAAMYHDCAKEWDTDKAVYYLLKDNIDITTIKDYEVHAYAAAAYLKHYYAIDDETVLDAITHHTTGSSNQLMAKVLFVADKIEPTRNYNTTDLFEIAKADIHQAFDIIKAQHEAYNTSQGGKQ